MSIRRMQKSRFAEHHGLTAGRISQLIADDKLGADEHGILLDDYRTVRWLESRALRQKMAEEAAEAGDIPREPVGSLQAQLDASQMPLADRLDAQRVLRDIELKETRRQQMELKIAADQGVLIPREYVAQRLAEFGTELKTHLLLLPKRIAAQLTAQARTEGERAVQSRLEDEIESALGAVIEKLTFEGGGNAEN